MSWPTDWYDQLAGGALLPVVVFLHGGNEFAADFMFDKFRIKEWWRGVFGTPAGAVRVKAIAIALQGVTTDSEGGDWNSGILGQVPRALAVDDDSDFFGELDRLEQFLIDDYDANHLPSGAPPIVAVFDRKRLMLVGFSNGGQMAYRLVTVAAANGWTVTAVCVFATSIGGWYALANLAGSPDVDWSPTVIPSLLHVHGSLDPAVNFGADGASANVLAGVGFQVAPVDVPTYARADISGVNSAAPGASPERDCTTRLRYRSGALDGGHGQSGWHRNDG